MNTIGIIAAENLELPKDIWKDSKESTLTSILRNFPEIRLLEGNIFFRKLLIAEGSPPITDDTKSEFLVQRLKSLMELGALEEVDTILKLANSNSKSLLEVWKDNALLTNRLSNYCEKIALYPNLETEEEIKILCLANRKEWKTASFVLKSSVLLGNISKINEELLLLYLDPKFNTSTNFAEEEVLSPLTFYLGKILSIRLKDRNLTKKYYFLDINNKYDFDKRLAAKKMYVKSGTLPFYEILNDIDEPFYSYNYINFDELISSDKFLMTKNKYVAEEVQKVIIRLSHNFEDPDLLIPLLKFFSKKMEKAYSINPIEKSDQFFILSYLLGNSWLPISPIKINKYGDLLIAKNIKSKTLTKEMIEDEINCDKFCLSISETFLEPKNDRYRFRNPPKKERVGEKLLTGLKLLSQAEESSPKNISSGLTLIMEAGQRRAAEKFAIEILIRRHLKKKHLEEDRIKGMIAAFKNQKDMQRFEKNNNKLKTPIEQNFQNFSKILDIKANKINIGEKNFELKGKIRANKFSLELRHDF
ncbi:MAG: hypothetical protein ACJZ8A_02400 [Paracoccaceae bacterium]